MSVLLKIRRMWGNKLVRWLLIMAVSTSLLDTEAPQVLVVPLFLYAVSYPSIVGMIFFWKLFRFNNLPGPIQLAKGFSAVWPTIKKGPIVTRVHRVKKSSTS